MGSLAYRIKNRKKLAAQQREYRAKNPENCRKAVSNCYSKNPEKAHARSRKHYDNNRERIIAKSNEHYREKREQDLAVLRKYFMDNHKKIISDILNGIQKSIIELFEKLVASKRRITAYKRQHYIEHRAKYAIQARERECKRYKNDPLYKVIKSLCCRMRQALKGEVRVDRYSHLISCTPEQFREWIQSHFAPGMHWNNHGFGPDKWHVDHSIACKYFDLSKEDEQRRCFHYTNLQPMWQPDNLSKGAKTITQVNIVAK